MNVRTKVPTSTEQVVEQVAAAAPAHPLVVHQPTAKVYPAKIAKAILTITRALQPVAKAGTNTFHKYQYPKWEDVLDELGPKMSEGGLIIQMDEVSHAGFQDGRMMEVTYEFTIINEDGDCWPDKPHLTQMCKLVDNKGQIDDKAASKAHTQAHKYFLMQLFKIRTRDMAEADQDGDQPEQQAPRKRPVPTSTGKVAPHFIKTVQGDTARTWAERFLGFFAKAETELECEQWDKLNDGLLTELSNKAPDTFNAVVDAMNAKLETFAKKAEIPETKVDPISSGPSTFPGDKPLPKTDMAGDIPGFLRRAPALSADEQAWLHGLGGAFSGCEDVEGLAKQQARLMTPQEGNVSAGAWAKANELLNEHLERLNEEAVA
ncbi:hypothetical protein ABIB86_000404 [Bradyrhizobium sp. JR1.7]|uniref:ERF family protein n=1 Tax=unclassified Bradyrhizobium TaxID=2631580 RepID=UPI00339342DD